MKLLPRMNNDRGTGNNASEIANATSDATLCPETIDSAQKPEPGW